MGFGDDLFGEDLFGEPLPDGNAGTRSTAPRALLMNATTRGFDLDVNGRYIDLHPVDGAVQSALLAVKGRIPAAPTTGANYPTIEPYTDNAPKTAEYVVRAALSRLVLRGDITIESIEYEDMPSGIKVQVFYFNNRIANSERRSVSTSG